MPCLEQASHPQLGVASPITEEAEIYFPLHCTELCSRPSTNSLADAILHKAKIAWM